MKKIFHCLDTLAGGCVPSVASVFIGSLNNSGVVLTWNVDDQGRPYVDIETSVPVNVVER